MFTSVLAERARCMDESARVPLRQPGFIANQIAMRIRVQSWICGVRFADAFFGVGCPPVG